MASNSKVKRLNDEGIIAFRDFIKERKSPNGSHKPVEDIFTNDDYVEVSEFNAVIELDKKFDDRYYLAEYLYKALHNQYERNRSGNEKDVGLWSWLGSVYFDQLSGSNVRAEPNYILDLSWQRWYRHSVFGPFYLYEKYGEYSRLHISGDITVMGNGIEQAISRGYLMSSKIAREMMAKIYADPNNRGLFKKDSLSQTAKKSEQILPDGKINMAGYGGIERFSQVFQSLKYTHHVQQLDTDELLDLMGDEFKKWIKE